MAERSNDFGTEMVRLTPWIATTPDQFLYIARRPCRLSGVRTIWATAGTGSATLRKCVSGQADMTTGTAMLATAIDVTRTANVIYQEVLSTSRDALNLQKDDIILLDSSTAGAFAGGALFLEIEPL